MHEPLAGRAHQRDRLGEEHAHRVAEGDRLLVDRAARLHLLERGGRQLDRGVQRQRRELLALRLLDRLGLLLGELAQATEQILRIAAEGEAAETAAFHARRLAERNAVGPLDVGHERVHDLAGALHRGGEGGALGGAAERDLE